LEEEADARRWRVFWVAAVTLIRAVGHVLKKVDGKDKKIKRSANAAFQKWKSENPEHQIFREFIERERNNLLKEYESDVYPLAEIHLAVEGERELYTIDENIFRPLLDDAWAGEDARDILTEAIEWWARQLDAIDQEASR